MNYINPKLKKYSRENRKNSTKGEQKLWKFLRNRQLLGYKFRRQYVKLSPGRDVYRSASGG